MKSELHIEGTIVELTAELGVAITYAIADVKRPEGRMGAGSKTVTLPGSKTLNALLTHIYDINYDIQTSGVVNFSPDFNPNLKASIRVYTNGLLQFTGYMKLIKVTRSQADLEKKFYDVVLFGEVATIYNDISDGKLADLDLSAYNHTYNKATQKATWTNTNYGDGYVYPMINYGGITPNTWDVTNLFPAVYHKTIIDAIFSEAGWTYDSAFLTGAFFKRLVLPFSGDKLTITAAQATARLFNSSLSANIDDSVSPTATQISSAQTEDPTVFDTEISDPSNQYNPATGVFTAASTGYYEFLSSGTVSAHATSTVTFAAVSPYNISLEVKHISGATTNSYTVGGAAGTTLSTISAGNDIYSHSIVIVSPTIYMLAGDTAHLRVNQGISHGTGASGTIRFRVSSGARFYNRVTQTQISDGNSLDMASVLPIDIRQADYLTSIFRTFNLYVEPDKTQPNRLVIEPEPDFYESGTIRDWTSKLDPSRPFEQYPMGALDALRYKIKYSDDSDYWNKFYKDKFKETYGEKNVDVTNDFLKNTNTNEVMFAATPLVGSAAHDRIIPEIYSLTNAGVQQPIRGKLRILYWEGTFNTNYSWTYTSSVSGNTTETTYPYAGHVDNPYNPTLDLSFGVPREIYYVNPYGATTYTDNNLYNQYHYQFITEITDRNSKLCTGHFWLKPLDILNLSFRDIIYIDGMNFRLSKVLDYNPASEDVTKVELLKIKHSEIYLTSNKTLTFTAGEVFSRGDSAPGYGGNVGVGDLDNSSNNVVVGRNNYVSDTASGVSINGSGNRVGNNCVNVSVFNSSGVVVLNDLRNVSVINTNNITVTDNDVSYLNGRRISGDTEWSFVNVSRNINEAGNYHTSGTITLTLVPANYRAGDKFNFKKTDSSATTFTLNGGGVNIDGLPTQSFATQYMNLTIEFNGTDFYIT